MGNPNLGCALLIALPLAACAPDVSAVPDASVRPDATVFMPEGAHTPFVIDSITLPTDNGEAEALGLDIDGDLEVDNQLGSIIALLSTDGADVNATVRGQIDRGEIIHLADIQATRLDQASNSAMYVWGGVDASPAPCLDTFDTVCRQHLAGTGTFTVESDNPDDAAIYGGVSAGHFSGGSGFVVLQVPLLISETPLTMELVGARAEVDVAATGLTAGRLAGAVTESYLENSVLPQLQLVLSVVVADDCAGVDPTCCTPGSDGETVIDLFDSNGNCLLSLEELQNSGLLDSLLAPDVDLFDEEGLAGSDGVDDSLSLGIGFSAVPGAYTIPSGL